MAFSDFDLRTAVHKFGLTEDQSTDLFVDVEPLEPSDFLRGWLNELAPIALGINSEQSRREYITSPVLVEAMRRAGTIVHVLPGVTLDVDKEKGLAGFCDYLMARSPQIYYVQAPILAVVEAKKEDLIAGLGQCAAEMVAIQLFNERDGTPLPAVFGCVTSGSNWRFLKLEGSRLFIDRVEYYLHDLAKILGILVSIARG
jgi:hypothetical protein